MSCNCCAIGVEYDRILLLLLPAAYDGLFVNVVNNCIRKKFSFEAACMTITTMLLSLPKFFSRVLGFETGSTSGAAGLGATAKAGGSVRAFVTDFRKYIATGSFGSARRRQRRSRREDLSKDTNDADAGGDGGD